MEPVLSGVPQFILASINALITATVARYVMGLEGRLVGKRKKQQEPDNKLKIQWYLIFFGWWAVALSTVMVIGRIVASAWSLECWQFDVVALMFTFVGYVLLASTNAVGWKLRPWCV